MSSDVEPVTRRDAGTIRVPAPTAWPVVLAFGITLTFAGLVTTVLVSIAGVLLVAIAARGWFHEVLPEEAHELVAVIPVEPAPAIRRRAVARVGVESGLRRAWLPLEIYPVAAGIKGGLAGAVAMALLAMAYGVVSGNGMWYAVNLLAEGLVPRAAPGAGPSVFSGRLFLVATAIHLVISILVGVLYAAMLPILPRRPIVLGGLVAPFGWSVLVHSILAVVNPLMNQRIDWLWFVLSQCGFGVVAGIVVSRQERIFTLQRLPLAVRAGIEAPGLLRERPGGPHR